MIGNHSIFEGEGQGLRLIHEGYEAHEGRGVRYQRSGIS